MSKEKNTAYDTAASLVPSVRIIPYTMYNQWYTASKNHGGKKMRNSVSAVIQCPFFRKEMKNLLCCEGFVEGTCMTTSFADRRSALDYISANCTHKNGGNCPMASKLFEKYSRLHSEQEQAEREWRNKLLSIKGHAARGDNYTESHTYTV